MSQIWIESTKAARERLKMMRNPAALTLPFDVARIAPFGLRVFDGEHAKHQIRLTYQDQDIGTVAVHAGADAGGFSVNLLFEVTPSIEVAVRRIFRVVMQHMDQVARVEAQERQQARVADPDAALLRL